MSADDTGVGGGGGGGDGTSLLDKVKRVVLSKHLVYYNRTSLVRTLLMSNTWLGSTRI